MISEIINKVLQEKDNSTSPSGVWHINLSFTDATVEYVQSFENIETGREDSEL
jgi:hypothetical protein